MKNNLVIVIKTNIVYMSYFCGIYKSLNVIHQIKLDLFSPLTSVLHHVRES